MKNKPATVHWHVDKMPGTAAMFLILIFFGTLQGQPLSLAVKHTDDFELTGDGTAVAWKTADWVPLSKYKGTADYNTQVKLLYSDKGIYGVFSCQDKKITATLAEDFADLFKEDVVEVFFWPDETTPLYFEYELSPLNFELPIIVPNHKGEFLGWRPWHYTGERKTRHATKVVKNVQGDVTSWSAEFFIPYALLKPLQNINPKPGTQWRANFYRIDYDRAYSSWVWNPVTTNFHDYEHFGTIRFE